MQDVEQIALFNLACHYSQEILRINGNSSPGQQHARVHSLIKSIIQLLFRTTALRS